MPNIQLNFDEIEIIVQALENYEREDKQAFIINTANFLRGYIEG